MLKPLIVLALSVSPVLGQGVDLPATPAGDRAGEYLAIHNAGDAEAFARFVAEDCTPDMQAAIPESQRGMAFNALRSQTGELTPHSILEQTEHGLSVLVEFADGAGWGRLDVAVEAEPPHLVSGFTIRPASPPGDGAGDDGFGEWGTLEELLGIARERAGVPAITGAVVRDGALAEAAAVGVRELGRDGDVTVNDRFHVGSVTKSMTATMIGRLVDRGVIGWDTTIGEALPGVEMLDVYRAVTLGRVLRHRGGITQHQTLGGAEFQRLLNAPGSATEQRGAYVAEILMAEPAAEPGTAMLYSNAGYTLAAHIAEVATGQPWEELMRAEVFEPLGMASAGLGWPADAQDEQPRGHYGTRPHAPDAYRLGAFLGPAGDVHCTASDLARYLIAHLAALRGEGDYLSRATAEYLHSPPEGGEYACGWIVARTPDGAEAHWHNGSAGTFYAYAVLAPATGDAVALIANAAAPNAEPTMQRVARELMSR